MQFMGTLTVEAVSQLSSTDLGIFISFLGGGDCIIRYNSCDSGVLDTFARHMQCDWRNLRLRSRGRVPMARKRGGGVR